MFSNSATGFLRFVKSRIVLETIHVLVTQSFRVEKSRDEPKIGTMKGSNLFRWKVCVENVRISLRNPPLCGQN